LLVEGGDSIIAFSKGLSQVVDLCFTIRHRLIQSCDPAITVHKRTLNLGNPRLRQSIRFLVNPEVGQRQSTFTEELGSRIDQQYLLPAPVSRDHTASL
jgi:hypothetical protein